MKMTEFLHSVAPSTTEKFMSYLMFSYGIGNDAFERKPLRNRLIEVHRYFGYSMTIPEETTTEQMQERITHVFKDYEELMLKYPDGIPDPLKAIAKMSNKEKDDYLAVYYKRVIMISLCHSLVPFSKKKLSLKDALVERILSKVEQLSKEKAQKDAEEAHFWNEVVMNFDRSAIPPF